MKQGNIIAEGFHRLFGAPHGEAAMVENAKQSGCYEQLRGADLYVTLEPCSHHGKTPPCSQAIIDAGFSRVFFCVPDPHPLTAGVGPQQLREAGLEVKVVNKVQEGRPHIVDMLKNQEVDFIINTTEGKQAIADSFMIRRTALQNKVCYTTTMAGGRASVAALRHGEDRTVHSLQSL